MELTESDKKLLSDIETYGVHVVLVMEDESGPGFGYSIGLYKTYGHPEVIIVGLKHDLIMAIINDIADKLKEGSVFESFKYYSDLIEGFKCYFTEVDKRYYEEYVGHASWYYKNDEFPLLQCIYPTVKGIFPWQPEWPENIKKLQPVLGIVK